MPRIRTIKPDFFTSPDVAQASHAVRLFYQALWCWADDFGIGETNINGLLGFAFPDSDGFTAQDLRRFCADCAQHFGITFYTVRGRHYYAIPTWEKHQKLERRTDRRKHPTPEDPDATPDQRIYGSADFAPELPRKGSAESGEMSAGKGRGSDLARIPRIVPASATTEPPLQCPKHINDLTPPPCGLCGDARKANKAWKETQRQETEQRKSDYRAAIAECGACDDRGLIEIREDELIRCTHQKELHA